MRSMDMRRQQKISIESYPEESKVKPKDILEAPSMSTAQIKTNPCGDICGLLEEILERGNLLKALKRVEKNKGSAGIDGMKTKELRSYLKEEWLQIKEMILEGNYTPQPVKRVEIRKPEGGIRLLGIPTVLDRMIQQAITQVITKIYEPIFSDHSHGFRPGRKAHDAIQRARKHIDDGYLYVVDIDLEKYFDKVNHDKLMHKLSERIKDKRVLRLIRKYLESGIMINGLVTGTQEGVPQGGNLSPLLSNIMLDELDKELEARGHKFERYADDCNIYVKNIRSGKRVFGSIRRFLKNRLKLKVNEEKSGVDRVDDRRFLGFSFYPKGYKTFIRLAPRTVKRLKDKLRDIFAKGRSQSIQTTVSRINEYLRGWIGYYQIASMYRILSGIDKWIRRHLRAILWNQWKKPRTRYKNLTRLGVGIHEAIPVIRSGKRSWRISSTPPIHQALGVEYFEKLNLINLVKKHDELRQNCSTAVYGAVCTVV